MLHTLSEGVLHRGTLVDWICAIRVESVVALRVVRHCPLFHKTPQTYRAAPVRRKVVHRRRSTEQSWVQTRPAPYARRAEIGHVTRSRRSYGLLVTGYLLNVCKYCSPWTSELKYYNRFSQSGVDGVGKSGWEDEMGTEMTGASHQTYLSGIDLF